MADIRVALRLDDREFTSGMRNARGAVQGLSNDITGLLGAIGVGLGVREIIAYTAEWQNLQNKIRATFETTSEQVRAFGDIRSIAAETRSSLADVADLYTKVKIAGDALKLTQTEIAQVTETFTKALKASGAGAQQTSAAILQFGQALASGKLQGDEFRSLMENAPVFMRALSQALGTPIGDLKKLASEGAITSEVILAATQEMADGIETKFGQTVPTITDSFTQMQNTIIETFGRMEESTGALNKIFTFVGNNIITILKVIGTLMLVTFGASVIRSVGIIATAFAGLIKTFQTLRTVIMGAAAAQAFMTGMTGVGLAAIAASVAAVGAAYYAMDQLFAQGDAKIQENNTNYETLTKTMEENAAASRKTAAEALAAGKAKAQAEKDATKAAREAAAEARRIARERERDLERARDQIITIKEQTQSIQDQYNLDVKRLFLTSEEADLQQRILDIQKERRRQLAEVSKLERLTPTERAAQEEEINKIFDDRLELVKATGNAMIELRAGMDYASQKRNIDAETAAFAVNLATRKKLIGEFNSFNIQQITETGKIEEDYARQRELLQRESNGRIAAMKVAGDVEAQEREKANLDRTLGYLTQIRDAQIQSVTDRTNAERTFYEENRKFAQGWAEAYGQYFEQLRVTVEDQAGYAKRIFSTITEGFTNSIMKFVETGKLSFKDLFRSLMMEIIKMQVNKLFLSIFGKGGPMSSLFAGLFANGGHIPSGKFGIAGERGPEIVTGPANVVSTRDTAALLSGPSPTPSITQVTYNINAVDAMSFKQMVARDPEFIYSVTQVGARRLPR
jgi:tape measure domain-containing protein